MSSSELPPRASLAYLKKLAKERLRELKRADPTARLARAQLRIAREHGFPSWRALKAEVDRRAAPSLAAFIEACAAGDLDALGLLLDSDPALARTRTPQGTTGLHLAVAHPDAVRLLLEHGADPNARDEGDNALPLHFAAGAGYVESARALLDAGSDVHGLGDAHRLEPIGWATVFGPAHLGVVELLVERGAVHHVFSAVALGDRALLRRVVAADSRAIRRRLAATEQGQTALHYVIAPPDGLVGGLFRTGDHYHTLETLIELGAELDARDAKGRTALDLAMLRGDREAMRLLAAAGAKPTPRAEAAPSPIPSSFADSIARLIPMLGVPDMEVTVAWYRAMGFELRASHEEGERMDWASVALGAAEIMFVPSNDPWRGQTAALSLWLRTDRLDDLYASLKSRQLARAGRVLAVGASDEPEVRFSSDLYTTFFGQREFCVRDPNGVEVCFFQPAPTPP